MSDVERLERRLGARLGQAVARLRRGALYKYADELGCNKIALGHHAELERAHPGLTRSLLGALSRVDLGSLPIPRRRSVRPGDRVSVPGATAPTVAAALVEGLAGGG